MGFAVSEVTLAATSLAEITDAILESQPAFKWDAVNNSFKAIVGTWTVETDANCNLGCIATNRAAAPAQNDAVGLGSVFIPVDGTYEVRVVAVGWGDCGNIHVHLSGVDKATIDMYLAVGDQNTSKTVTLGVLTKGLYAVSIIVSDKNGASSAYKCALQTMLINKTA